MGAFLVPRDARGGRGKIEKADYTLLRKTDSLQGFRCSAGRWHSPGRRRLPASALEAEIGGDLLAVVVQVLDAQLVRADAVEALADQLAALLDRIEPALHRQFQVEYRVSAASGGDP